MFGYCGTLLVVSTVILGTPNLGLARGGHGGGGFGGGGFHGGGGFSGAHFGGGGGHFGGISPGGMGFSGLRNGQLHDGRLPGRNEFRAYRPDYGIYGYPYYGAYGFDTYNPYYYDTYPYADSSPTYDSYDMADGSNGGTTVASPSPADNETHMTVNVPADAQILVDGVPMTSTGPVRHFHSPPLTPGRDYSYNVEARWNDNGKEVTKTQKVSVSAGSHPTVNFPVARETAPQMSAAQSQPPRLSTR